MQIETLFKLLSLDKSLIIFLFEHRDKQISFDEVEHFCPIDHLEALERVEIIELYKNSITLDQRVILFIENYIDISSTIEISSIDDKLEMIVHNIELLKIDTKKRHNHPSIIMREIKKIDFILMQNLLNLRNHVDRVYKSIEEYNVKIHELKFYKKKLSDFTLAMQRFESFIILQHPILYNFMNDDLNYVIKQTRTHLTLSNKTLIVLTQDVLEYINRAEHQNIFIEKITKLKELKDRLELNQRSNFRELADSFDLLQTSLSIKSRLNHAILEDEQLNTLVEKLHNSTLKTKKSGSISHHPKQQIQYFFPVNELHAQFKSSSEDLIHFLSLI